MSGSLGRGFEPQQVQLGFFNLCDMPYMWYTMWYTIHVLYHTCDIPYMWYTIHGIYHVRYIPLLYGISHIHSYITGYIPCYFCKVYHMVYIILIQIGIYRKLYAIYHTYITWYISWYIPVVYHIVYTIYGMLYIVSIYHAISHIMVYHMCHFTSRLYHMVYTM